MVVCIAAPVLSVLLDLYSAELLGGFEFGFTILAVNAALAFAGLWVASVLGRSQRE